MSSATSNSWLGLIIALFLFTRTGQSLQEGISSGEANSYGSRKSTTWPTTLYDGVVAKNTISAIAADKHLRQTYMAILSMCIDASRNLAEIYGVPELDAISDDLDRHLRQVNVNTEVEYRLDLRKRRSTTGTDEDTNLAKRQGLIGGLLSGLVGGGNGGKQSAAGPGGKGIGGIISNAATNIFGNVLNMSGPALVRAGFFGGVGAGEGAAQGLDLLSADLSKSAGATVAEENGMQKKGLNPMIEQAAMALTATAVKALRMSNIFQLPPLGPVAAAAGSGLGSGAASGLNLTLRNLGPPANASDLASIAGSFAFGASKSLAENVKIGGASLTALLPNDLGPAALEIGRGLGAGAASGLKLGSNTNVPPPPPASQSDVPGIARTFSFGLSEAVARNIDKNSLSLGSVVPNLGDTVLNIGNGLGTGAAAGLKLINSTNAAPPQPVSSSDIPGLARTLSFGLSKAVADNINPGSISLGNFIPDIGGTVLGVADGLGTGAALGLKLTNDVNIAPPPPASSSVPDLARTFAFGLSKAVTENLNTSSLNIGSMIPDFGDAVLGAGSGLGSGAAAGLKLTSNVNLAPPTPSSSSDIPGIARTFAFGLSKAVADNFNTSGVNIASALPDVGAAALSVGQGIGSGAAMGLKLTTKDLAPPPPTSLSDLTRIAGTFAFGLSKSVVDGANLSSMNLGSMLPEINLGNAALTLGAGLGGGAAMGLKLTTKDLLPPPPTSSSDVPNIAGRFAFGLSKAVADNLNVSSMSLSSVLPSVDVGAAALSVGTGLGSGAAQGLKLTNNADVPPPPESPGDIPRIAGRLVFGLSKAVTDNLNTTDLIGRAAGIGGIGGLDMTETLRKFGAQAASGLGKGIGGGAAVGLGLQPDTPAPPGLPDADGTLDVGGIAQAFASGLTSRFLANGTASNAINSFSGDGKSIAGLTSSLDFGRITGGLARGLLAGAGDGIEAIGGINALINGTTTMPTGTLTETKTTFNDSVGGAATGFGQGLGSSGVITAQKLLARGVDLNPLFSNAARGAKRDISGRMIAFSRRQAELPAGAQSGVNLNLSRLLSAESVSSIGQKVLDVLGSEGIGGLGLIAFGLTKSMSINPGGFDERTAGFLKALIPRGTIRVVNGLNSYEIDGDAISKSSGASISDTVSINGTGIIKFVVFVGLHDGSIIGNAYAVREFNVVDALAEDGQLRYWGRKRLLLWAFEKSFVNA
ncbi:hypothetical protein DCS_05813 [Drechmeria coniospora]|uniref:Uncharacterized protein n=1 Tax=Drechmeria coniospora TaxID=98403 RepID=A0A151GNV8_DRECN|nr:hypothetical protein DCS_05813 [Drechmeria coniospora]KYK58795.1 hypothetical protein DCS_05813 [Drechmeria coniospora]